MKPISKNDHLEMNDVITVNQQLDPIAPSYLDNTTWAARRDRLRIDEKRLMAAYCARHDFLVPEGLNPETDHRETIASILVNQGTTPHTVVKEVLGWIRDNQRLGPFDITWYTPGTLIPSTLLAFRQENPHLTAATQLFMFPGRVDFQIQAVAGPEAVTFAERLERCFTYAFLSTNSFNMEEGTAYFHYPEEIRLQVACAKRYAAHKFLFLDSSKFKREGDAGYRINNLLETSEAVTIYTVSSKKDPWIKTKFEVLGERLLETPGNKRTSARAASYHAFDMKALRLRIIGQDETPTYVTEHKGFLKTKPAPSAVSTNGAAS